MKIPSKLLLRLALSYGLMNREAFEAQITRLLSDHMDNPGDMNKLYDFLFSQMDDLKDYLSVEHIVEASARGTQEDLMKEMQELRHAIDLLNEKIDKQQRT